MMPGTGSEVAIVVTDANILINLLHVQMLWLLGRLTGYRFVIPEEVQLEIKEETQAAGLSHALAQNVLSLERMEGIAQLSIYTELRGRFGVGESACLSMAQARNWLIATDERRAFRQEVLRRLGAGRLLNTPGIILLAIKAGSLSVEDADEAKRQLENKRFRMKFGSFRELLEE
jgi:predicted nucleic acid-binding protein